MISIISFRASAKFPNGFSAYFNIKSVVRNTSFNNDRVMTGTHLNVHSYVFTVLIKMLLSFNCVIRVIRLIAKDTWKNGYMNESMFK